MWNYLNLTRIYTKPKGQLPDYSEPVILRGDNKTVEGFVNKIHRTLLAEFKHAVVWGSSVKERFLKIFTKENKIEFFPVISVNTRLLKNALFLIWAILNLVSTIRKEWEKSTF